MSDGFLQIDGVPEHELPAHTNDGKSGDRVSLLEGGLLHVENRRAAFAQWSDVLAVREHEDRVYVLVPRRPPSPPWMEITAEMRGGEPASKFAARLAERSAGGGGYRDAVRKRRQNLSTNELRDRILARKPVPGALEVPSTIMLGGTYPWRNFVQGAIFFGFSVPGFVAMEIFSAAGHMGADSSEAPGWSAIGYVIFLASVVAGGALAVFVAKKWKEIKDRTMPRQRVLVLAPDGCIVGFSSGAKIFGWSQVGAFERSPNENGDDALVVRDSDGSALGEIDAGWLDAPLGLVVGIAETYREAASDG